MNLNLNNDVEAIANNTTLEGSIFLSNELFDKKISYCEFYDIIKDLSFVKKYIFYIVHILRSYYGDKYLGMEVTSIMSVKEILDNDALQGHFKFLNYYDTHKYVYEIFNMTGVSDTKKIYLKKIKKELENKKIKLHYAKRKLAFVRRIDSFLSNDLIESIFDYLPNDDNINDLKNIKSSIYISIKNTKDYYDSIGLDYYNIYCYSWKLMNNAFINHVRPSQRVIHNYQILPYLFNQERYYNSCDGNCDYCLYKIDYPRQKYLHDKYKNDMRKGKHSNFYNNWIKYQYYLCSTIGRCSKRTGFISIYDRKNYYKKNIHPKYKSHLILKNNISAWKNFENVWQKINNNE